MQTRKIIQRDEGSGVMEEVETYRKIGSKQSNTFQKYKQKIKIFDINVCLCFTFCFPGICYLQRKGVLQEENHNLKLG